MRIREFVKKAAQQRDFILPLQVFAMTGFMSGVTCFSAGMITERSLQEQRSREEELRSIEERYKKNVA